jgi:hypothetical protein
MNITEEFHFLDYDTSFVDFSVIYYDSDSASDILKWK